MTTTACHDPLSGSQYYFTSKKRSLRADLHIQIFRQANRHLSEIICALFYTVYANSLTWLCRVLVKDTLSKLDMVFTPGALKI
ncbi:hypothetical protein HBH56_003210 [Parastagonospora nodorum]|uniref:Uncharacterized protein n=1 Tax=Phaeosphaeria nodorum (strain SN15 / ATCC MYA-4574 / FGSC 10173) TaxID=321614 RepID=Q0UF06_PHANO|nr:hypothetical protein SNOG_09658 [Parastagonospora nodorum SN15]KAH3920338.1 hypothetical protein HBH56_003210 [Parastagonospora nodorum]EAT82923.1 hypothetical protein SNOG_09658 [Parastagonospora nodorum SN15]KAH3937629.1 hypothetical protein HBH54_003200 [Parastagonospora nodorum]KAH3978240.1 hypothetical protein HBH52_106840 [Parastagonospora nodorum]KAH4001731.1 hypothetical protein HBI10_088520 [Parastagonospora nodorum]